MPGRRTRGEDVMPETAMETVLLVDPLGGLSGDMFLGAFLDLGLPREKVRANLATVGLGSCFDMETASAVRHGISAARVDFPALPGAAEQPAPNTLTGIEELLGKASLPDRVAAVSREIFKILACAEARVHGRVSPEAVHFHEVGDYDTLADIIGTATALDYFAPRRRLARPVPLGTGFIEAAHGRLPLPVPAVAVLLEGLQVVNTAISSELVTPTGAAIYRWLVENLPAVAPETGLRLERFGYGAGCRDLVERPNLLRLGLAGVPAAKAAAGGNPAGRFRRENVVVLETLIDDLSPEKSAALSSYLRAAGALDVAGRPVQMKKGRLGLELVVITAPEDESRLVEVLFAQSPTLGIRRREVERYVLERELREFSTSFGRLRGKLARDLDGRIRNFKLEHDDLVVRAREQGLSPALLESLATAEIVKQLDDIL